MDGQPVLDQAVVRELGEFLDPDAGVAQDLDGGPGPERVVFFAGQVAAFAGAGVLGPDPARSPVAMTARRSVCPPAVNTSPGPAAARRRAGAAACRARSVDGGDQDGQDGQPFAGPLVHAGLAAATASCVLDVARPDRAGHGPRPPPGRVVDGPLGDVEVERADGDQGVGRCGPGRAARGAAGAVTDRSSWQDPLLPAGGDRRGQAQRADAGMVEFQVLPEQPAQDVARLRRVV